MLLGKVVQNRKNRGRCCGGRVKVFILNRGIDAGICPLLNLLIHRKQAAQGIGDIGAVFIQAHSQDLLRTESIGIFDIVGF